MKQHICPKCNTPKPLNQEHYYKDKTRPSGFNTYTCKVCKNKYQKKHYTPAAGRRSDKGKDKGKDRLKSVAFDDACFKERLQRTGDVATSRDRPIEKAIPSILAE